MTVDAFEVLDALEGTCALARRTPTLDGSVPLRVAQGCVPALEGNAFGWQVVMRRPATVRRAFGRWKVAFDDEAGMRARVEGAIPRLIAQGFLDARWGPVLKRLAWVERAQVQVWTGLLVRPLHGLALRIAQAANRRNRSLDVRTDWVEGDQLTPLVVSFTVSESEARLEGEIACLSPHPPPVAVSVHGLAAAPELGERHAAFFDDTYFAEKKEKITGKYRRLLAHLRSPRHPDEGGLELVTVGPVRLDVEARRAVFSNQVSFSASYDGHTLSLRPDAGALAAGGAAVEATWRAVYGDGSIERDRRALWYLTKYFTPHPPGEPHFFVKPYAFVRTPPGWSTLVEGICGAGYDIMRGVVATDHFHATPAVFALHGTTADLRVPAGRPLIGLYPVPRWTLNATWRALQFSDAVTRVESRVDTG